MPVSPYPLFIEFYRLMEKSLLQSVESLKPLTRSSLMGATKFRGIIRAYTPLCQFLRMPFASNCHPRFPKFKSGGNYTPEAGPGSS